MFTVLWTAQTNKGQCSWKDKLAVVVLHVIFKWCEHHKHIFCHVHCLGVTADISESTTILEKICL